MQFDLIVSRVESPAAAVMNEQAAGLIFVEWSQGLCGPGPGEQVSGFGDVGGPAARFLWVRGSMEYGDIAAVDFLDLVERQHLLVESVWVGCEDGIV